MKKIYISPATRVVKINVQPMLSGSLKSLGDEYTNTDVTYSRNRFANFDDDNDIDF